MTAEELKKLKSASERAELSMIEAEIEYENAKAGYQMCRVVCLHKRAEFLRAQQESLPPMERISEAIKDVNEMLATAMDAINDVTAEHEAKGTVPRSDEEKSNEIK